MSHVWEQLVSNQKSVDRSKLISVQTPCAIALLSDLHIGHPSTDYRSIMRDAKLVRDTPYMYAGFVGDGVDNWIVSKLQFLQRNQAVNFDTEWGLFLSWIELLKDKMVFMCSGNHDYWSYLVAGVDRVKEFVRGTKMLYGSEEINFSLEAGPAIYRVKVRHKWRGSSIYNPTHGIETGWERGSDQYDIGIGGHTHIATLHRPFIRQAQMVHAILVGTYKKEPFAGLPNPYGQGSGAMIFDKDGAMTFIYDLENAASYLNYLRSKP